MITELKQPFPVIVTSQNNQTGLAWWIRDIGAEQHLQWGVVFDDNGEIWWVENKEIRAQTNWTMGRMRPISDIHTARHREEANVFSQETSNR